MGKIIPTVFTNDKMQAAGLKEGIGLFTDYDDQDEPTGRFRITIPGQFFLESMNCKNLGNVLVDMRVPVSDVIISFSRIQHARTDKDRELEKQIIGEMRWKRRSFEMAPIVPFPEVFAGMGGATLCVCGKPLSAHAVNGRCP